MSERPPISPRSPRAALEPEQVPPPPKRSDRARNPFVIVGNAIITLLLIAMIENASAVDDLEAILAVPGLDAIFIGPYDLSASLGPLADFEQPDFKSALAEILRRATVAGVASGIHVVDPSPEGLKSRIAEGHLFIAYSIDAVMMRLSAERPPEDVTV